MVHQRQAIRHAVALALQNATDAGDRVFLNREEALRPVELPAIAIYTLDETVDPASRDVAPRELRRTLSLAVVAVVMLNDAPDDALDALALQIEARVARDETFGANASDAMLISTEVAIDTKAARPVGMARLTFNVWYFTDAPYAVDENLDDLKTVTQRTNLGGKLPVGNEARDVETVGAP